MNAMKILLMTLVAFLLTACGNQAEGGSQANDQASENGGDPINFVATTTHAKDIVTQIGGDHIEVDALMGPGVDPHEYQPSSADVEALQNAEVVAYNGLHLEGMFDSVFESLDEMGKDTLILADALSEDQILASDEDDLAHDPHIWFSVENWRDIAQHTADYLSNLDPANEADYQANAENYLAELDELDDYINSRIEEVPEESRYLITAHDAFNYFGEDFDFEVVGIQGLNTKTEAGTGDIADLADFIVENNIKAVFIESSVSDRNVSALVEAVESRGGNLEIGGELYSDALGSDEDGAGNYIDMYKANIDTIVDALK